MDYYIQIPIEGGPLTQCREADQEVAAMMAVVAKQGGFDGYGPAPGARAVLWSELKPEEVEAAETTLRRPEETDLRYCEALRREALKRLGR